MSDTYYGLNPSGGAHRLQYENGQVVSFETFTNAGWTADEYAKYEGWLDWCQLEDMPAAIQDVVSREETQ